MSSISNGLMYASPLCADRRYASVGIYTYMSICMYAYICACLSMFVSDCCVTFLLYLAINSLPFTNFSVLAFLFHSFLNNVKSQKKQIKNVLNENCLAISKKKLNVRNVKIFCTDKYIRQTINIKTVNKVTQVFIANTVQNIDA